MPLFKKRRPRHTDHPHSIDSRPTPSTDQGHPHSRITFFGGKGGVGKTTCSAAYAYGAAMAGHRTLLVSTDPAHSLGDLLETSVGDEPKQLLPDLWVRELNPEKAAKKYLDEVRSNLRRLASPHLWAEVERQLDIASASPGADETALFDELVRIIIDADGHYDHVVFDTAPTGHTLRLLSLPELLGIWVEGMLMRREKVQQMNRMWNNIVGVREERTDPVYQLLLQRKNRFAQARHILLDAQQTTFFFVINPEQLPILETAKALRILEKYHITVGGIIVNRVLPKEADGTFLAQRRAQEAEYLEWIEREFQGLSKIYIPLRARDIRGLEGVQWVAEQMQGQFIQ
ncbi:MAG: ArsA family ATPase [Bacillota bacterium]